MFYRYEQICIETLITEYGCKEKSIACFNLLEYQKRGEKSYNAFPYSTIKLCEYIGWNEIKFDLYCCDFVVNIVSTVIMSELKQALNFV